MHNANGTELFPAGLSVTAFGPSIRHVSWKRGSITHKCELALFEVPDDIMPRRFKGVDLGVCWDR